MRFINLLFYFTIIVLLTAACQESADHNHNISEEQNNQVDKLDTNLVVPVDDGRINWQKPELVIRMLGDIAGESVADIGAGTGYFSFRLALKAAKVIAVEIDPKLIQIMDAFGQNLPADVKGRFETRLGEPADPGLSEDEVDNILIINTITYIEDQIEYLNTLKHGLKKGGILMIVDYKMKRLPIEAPGIENRMPLHKIEDLVTEAGYTLLRSDDTSLQYQYIVVAQL